MPARRPTPFNRPRRTPSPETARITALKVQGHDVIRLDAGTPDLPPAPHIIEALAQAAANPCGHGSQPYNDTRALRQAWAEMYLREYGVKLDADSEVLPLMGSKEGIVNLGLGTIDPGEVVLAPDPGYMTYIRSTQLAGGEPYVFALREQDEYLPDLESIPAGVLQLAKLLWLNYPNNPTAATASLAFFAKNGR